MKKMIGTATLLIAMAMTTTSVQASDPCETVICMFGLLNGNGVVEDCDGAVKDYFSIVKKKRGKFSASRTKQARAKALECPTDISGQASKINDKFGGQRFF